MKTEFLSDRLFESDLSKIEEFVRNNEFASSGEKLIELLSLKGISVNDFIELLHNNLFPQKDVNSLKRNVRNWINNKVVISRNTAFQICLILNLTIEESQEFFTKVLRDKWIQHRIMEDYVFNLAIKHKLSNSDVMKLLERINSELIREKENIKSTEFLRVKSEGIDGQDSVLNQIYQLILEMENEFTKQNTTANKYFSSCIDSNLPFYTFDNKKSSNVLKWAEILADLIYDMDEVSDKKIHSLRVRLNNSLRHNVLPSRDLFILSLILTENYDIPDLNMILYNSGYVELYPHNRFDAWIYDALINYDCGIYNRLLETRSIFLGSEIDLRYPLAVNTILKQNYLILEMYGKGSSSLVYRGIDNVSGKNVLIKELYPETLKRNISRVDNGLVIKTNILYSETEAIKIFNDYQSNFEREYHIYLELQKSNYMNIDKVIDFNAENNTLYLVIETENENIDVNIVSLRFSRKLQIMKSLSEAIEELHKRDFLHLDLSPDNILAYRQKDDMYRIRLIDFNSSSQLIDGKIKEVYSKKENYSAYEIVTENYNLVGYWTDVYSIVACFWITDHALYDEIEAKGNDIELALKGKTSSSCINHIKNLILDGTVNNTEKRINNMHLLNERIIECIKLHKQHLIKLSIIRLISVFFILVILFFSSNFLIDTNNIVNKEIVEWTLENGDIYEGEILNNLYDGFGKLISGDKTYEGEFKAGMKSGSGVLIGVDYRYEGEFSNDNKNGSGNIEYNDGSRYFGEFKNGFYHGEGTFHGVLDTGERFIMKGVWSDYGKVIVGESIMEDPNNSDNIFIYSGTFKNYLLQGEGSVVINLVRYRGTFYDYKLEGEVEVYLINNITARALFENGVPISDYFVYDKEGKKEYIDVIYNNGFFRTDNKQAQYKEIDYGNGISYKGEMIGNYFHGNGTLITNDFTYDGSFVNGKLSGYGRQIHSNGEVYEGNFTNGYYEGEGVLYTLLHDGNKSEFRGVWSDEGHVFDGYFLLPDGTKYSGKYVDWVQVGKGLLLTQGVLFEGDFFDSFLQGEVKVTISDKESFYVEMKDGEMISNFYIYNALGEKVDLTTDMENK